MLSSSERGQLRRVISQMSRKGGVGKTSITSNVAGVFAAGGYRVLAIDLDTQGNLGRDLGYRRTDFDDQGEGMLNAIAFDKPLEPTVGIRENLDVVPAGDYTERLADLLQGELARGKSVSDRLALKLIELDVEHRYDMVLIDTPPGGALLQMQALVASRWIVVPTQPDDASLDGIEQLAGRVAEVRPDNPSLGLLGVVLFPIVSNASKIKERTRAKLSDMLGDAAPVFTADIRLAQAAAVDARERGQLAIELARDASVERTARIRALHDHDTSQEPETIARSAGSLADDYKTLAAEILRTLGQHERAMADEVVGR